LLAGDQGRLLDLLDSVRDDLRAALDWAEERGDVETGLRLAGSMPYWWMIRGGRVEGLQRLERLLALSGGGDASTSGEVDAAALSAGFGAAALLAWVMGRVDESEQFARRYLASARELGDQCAVGNAQYAVARALLDRGDVPGAREQLEQTLRLGHEMEDPYLQAWSLLFLGRGNLAEGRIDDARDVLARSAALFRSSGDAFGLGNALNTLGRVAIEAGDLDGAWRAYQERLGVAERLQHPVGASQALGGMGTVALLRGQLDDAVPLLRDGLRIARHQGAPLGPLLEPFAQLAAARGQPERAVRLEAAVRASRRGARPRTPAEEAAIRRWLEPALAALDERTREACQADGAAMTPDEAVAYACAGE
jgi:tetratricopeptide (TPR) repeat protein